MEQPMVFPGGFSLRDMVELSNVIGSLEKDIYFCRHSLVCNGKSMLGLVTFFSHLKKGDTFILKVEGEDLHPCLRVAEALDSIREDGTVRATRSPVKKSPVRECGPPPRPTKDVLNRKASKGDEMNQDLRINPPDRIRKEMRS
ncbi:hypothetical protein CHM34_15365 [Paludifilum halophilum]|uniref:HPr domain-containing protein n=1 Tax=Paludifilum halophilum TaxID=1642702 RepID=A0A235B310_9BACL|nr:hypothetical protein CHM34_15365 [Paludifilum halophilum]